MLCGFCYKIIDEKIMSICFSIHYGSPGFIFRIACEHYKYSQIILTKKLQHLKNNIMAMMMTLHQW